MKDKETDAKGVSEFLKEEEDKQKEEADRLAKEIREEKERKEREEAEAAKAKAEAERIEQVRVFSFHHQPLLWLSYIKP